MGFKWVITDGLVDWFKRSTGPVPGGDIADQAWGKHTKRPESRAAFHQTIISGLDKALKQESGRGLISTTYYRRENYPGESAERREAGRREDPPTQPEKPLTAIKKST